ncbi:MAG: hypothetical protein WDO18_01465 [Acidobacteriota bacterium]
MTLPLRLAGAGLWAALAAVAAFSPMHSAPASLAVQHRLHPRDTGISIRLGLELERAQRDPEAERVLLDAARLDHQHLPAWTLTNFYFRRQNTERFWFWARRTASLTYDDFRPLLRLTEHVDRDPLSVVARLGNRPELLRAYLDLLIAEPRRIPDALKIAALLAARCDRADRDRLAAVDGLH